MSRESSPIAYRWTTHGAYSAYLQHSISRASAARHGQNTKCQTDALRLNLSHGLEPALGHNLITGYTYVTHNQDSCKLADMFHGSSLPYTRAQNLQCR